MRIFTRYILREVTSYALLGGVLFTFVLFMRDLPKILDLLVRDSASLTDAVRIFGDMLPNTLTVTIPTAVLAGILLGLSRLAADSEVTAMRACGVGALSFVRIVSILSLTALAIGLVNALYFAPRGAADLLRLEEQLKTSQASVAIEPRVFYEDFKDKVLYVQDVRPTATAAWHHVFLADLTQPANPNITTADQASVSATSSGDTQRTCCSTSSTRASTKSPPPTPTSTTSRPTPPPTCPCNSSRRRMSTSHGPVLTSRHFRSANSGSVLTVTIPTPTTPAPPESSSTPVSPIPSPALS